MSNETRVLCGTQYAGPDSEVHITAISSTKIYVECLVKGHLVASGPIYTSMDSYVPGLFIYGYALLGTSFYFLDTEYEAIKKAAEFYKVFLLPEHRKVCLIGEYLALQSKQEAVESEIRYFERKHPEIVGLQWTGSK